MGDAYVLSDGTSLSWDTCGPHALLLALVGELESSLVLLCGEREGRGRGETHPSSPTTDRCQAPKGQKPEQSSVCMYVVLSCLVISYSLWPLGL